MESIISVNNLVKKFNTEKVLKGISFNIKKGEFVAIIGQSGSGKSTLLYLISGLDSPTDGDILYKETNIAGLSDREISKIRLNEFGFVFQFYNLIDNLTIEENIIYPTLLGKKMDKKKLKEKLYEITKKIGIQDKLSKYPYQLSGGEQQRAAIARALITSPSIIFADEPTGNLDSKTGIEIMNLLSEVNKDFGTTIIMVTHNESLSSFFDRIITIKDGKIYE